MPAFTRLFAINRQLSIASSGSVGSQKTGQNLVSASDPSGVLTSRPQSLQGPSDPSIPAIGFAAGIRGDRTDVPSRPVIQSHRVTNVPNISFGSSRDFKKLGEKFREGSVFKDLRDKFFSGDTDTNTDTPTEKLEST